jgi:hypothetical protein
MATKSLEMKAAKMPIYAALARYTNLMAIVTTVGMSG